MNRREALKRTALVMGTAVSATTVAGLMQGCKAEPGLTWTPSFFTEDQARTVSVMAEVIIPKTDTPGAMDAGVPKFIEDMVGQVYSEQQRTEFLSGLDAFNSTMDGDFTSLSAEDQTSRLEAMNAQMQEMIRSGVRKAPSPDMSFFYTMKELTVTGFFTSQPGATEVLQYSQIPMDYKGCISLDEAGGKTWAT